MKKLSFDKLNISRLSAFWGPDDKTTPLELLIDNGDPLLLELVLKHFLYKPVLSFYLKSNTNSSAPDVYKSATLL